MKTDNSQVSKFIDEISQRNGSLDDYNNLEIMFSRLDLQDFNHIAEQSKIVDMLIKMDLNDPEICELALKFTSKIFDTVDLKKYISNNPKSVNDVLTSENAQFKVFLLEKLISYISCPEEVTLHPSIIHNIFLNIYDKNEAVLLHARDYFLKHPNAFELINSAEPTKSSILDLKEFVPKLRILEMMVGLSAKDSRCIVFLENLLNPECVKVFLANEDVLIVTNFLQLVSDIAKIREGYKILVKSSEAFTTLMKTIGEDPLAELKKPYLNSLMISMMKMEPENWVRNEVLVKYFAGELSSGSLDAIQGLSYLLQFENCLPVRSGLLEGEWSEYLIKLRDLVYTFSSADESVLTCLSFLANVDEVKNPESFSFKAKLIRSLDTEKGLLNRIVEHSNVPFLKMRQLVLTFYLGIAKNDNTFAMILNHDKSVDYLLDRMREANIIEEKGPLLETKLEIAKILSNKTGDVTLKSRFLAYAQEGVYGTHLKTPNVAME